MLTVSLASRYGTVARLYHRVRRRQFVRPPWPVTAVYQTPCVAGGTAKPVPLFGHFASLNCSVCNAVLSVDSYCMKDALVFQQLCPSVHQHMSIFFTPLAHWRFTDIFYLFYRFFLQLSVLLHTVASPRGGANGSAAPNPFRGRFRDQCKSGEKVGALGGWGSHDGQILYQFCVQASTWKPALSQQRWPKADWKLCW